MSKIITVPHKKAFTLIELLIVVAILAMVFFLGLEGFRFFKPQPKALTPLNLKETIRSHEMFQKQATLICTRKCQKCFLRSAMGNPFVPYESKVDLRNLTAYTLNERDEVVELEYGRYKDEKICLVVEFYPNGSSTPLIIRNDTGIYYLPAFFAKAQKVESLDEAKALWLSHHDKLDDSGAYY